MNSKSDKLIHNICIASIKRSTIKPYDFKWTRFYDSNSIFIDSYQNISIELSENELIICSTIIDIENFSILTTRKLLTCENGVLSSGDLSEAIDKSYGDFKGYKRNSFTFGLIRLQGDQELKYFIETGIASMVMIHGVRTALRTNIMTHDQVDRVAKSWNKRIEE